MMINRKEFELLGFSILPKIYSKKEIVDISEIIDHKEIDNSLIRDSKDLFSIRHLLNSIPELSKLLFTSNLTSLLSNIFKEKYFLTKAIYFDKPKESNWFVPYHQDLSISVKNKKELIDYKNWTYKKGMYGVQPPLEILENTVTVRIHLDKTNEKNGALRVIPGSHLGGIIRNDSATILKENEKFCDVPEGGIMIMKPLLLHASSRTTNKEKRRVIHLEFNSKQIHTSLNWLEYKSMDYSAQN